MFVCQHHSANIDLLKYTLEGNLTSLIWMFFIDVFQLLLHIFGAAEVSV